MLAISSWKSPWFQANFGSTHVGNVGVPHAVGLDAWKKKSELPNSVNVGVRFGSALTMCSVCSSTVSARRCASGTLAFT